MADYTDSLDFNSETASEHLARVLAASDADLLWELAEIRRATYTQQDVAEKLGVTQATIAAFERYDNDPKLSTIRRYAHAIGAVVHHAVRNADTLMTKDSDSWDADAIVAISVRPQRSNVARPGWMASAS